MINDILLNGAGTAVEHLGFSSLSILILSVLGASFVDASVGGGGFIIFTALTSLGLPVRMTLGTVKLQNAIALIYSIRTFIKYKQLDGETIKSIPKFSYLTTLLAAIFGVYLNKMVDTRYIGMMVPVITMALIGYKVYSFNYTIKQQKPKMSPLMFFLSLGLLIPFYDGFFGPGTGTFYMLAISSFLGTTLLRASAMAKIMNLISCLATLSIFAIHGEIFFDIAVIVIVTSIIGANIGVKVSIKRGTKFLNILLISILAIVTVRMIMQYWIAK